MYYFSLDNCKDYKKEDFDGITRLVEHPIQLKAPCESFISISPSSLCMVLKCFERSI